MIQYSNIDDAWGHTYDKEIYKNSENKNNKINYNTDEPIENITNVKQPIEMMTNEKQPIENITIVKQPIENITNVKPPSDIQPISNIHDFENFTNHMKECPECRKKLTEFFYTNEKIPICILGIKFNNDNIYNINSINNINNYIYF